MLNVFFLNLFLNENAEFMMEVKWTLLFRLTAFNLFFLFQFHSFIYFESKINSEFSFYVVRR